MHALHIAGKELREDFSRRGIAYGADPSLYSGVDVACDLIEAEQWPPLRDGL